MQFSIASILALVAVAAANLHDSCACHNGDSYNWRITQKACELYATKNYEWGVGAYDEDSGRCVRKTEDDSLAGKQWEAACREIATTGFPCADGQGLRCLAASDDVRGRC